ncbi:MAG: T9SS type A sorting domain-containing protein [Rhodothermaceae bacterium]|nr:T9SS type A sorting domain-containing protein [Rhodothermaceae bacterium]
MKNKMLPIIVALLLMAGVNPAIAQSFEDFITETRGDTVVVIDAVESGLNNTLHDAIELDANPPEGRVYELAANGIYWFTRSLQTPEDRPLVIAGPDYTRLVQRDSELEPPNIHGTTVDGSATTSGFFQFRNDITFKNLIASPSATNNAQGWHMIVAASAGNTVTLENILFEHNNWVFVHSNDYEGTKLHIRDSYFLNMSGEPILRNGGIYDNSRNPTGELIVENSTHVMAQGQFYKFRSFKVDKAFFNHNTFVNVANNVLVGWGYHTNLTVTNNLFVNSNATPYFPGKNLSSTDQDSLPHGIINVAHLPEDNDSFDDWTLYGAERKILVFNNGVFWDDRLDDIVVQLNNMEARDRTDWVTQMITMNSRTQEIFNDNERYPLMNEGNWVMSGDPDFIDHKGLMTDMVDEIIPSIVDLANEGTIVFPKWRMPGNETSRGGDDGLLPYPDWPIPANLAYNNSEYLTAGLGNLPLGDLNWFPESKALFNANKDDLHAELDNALNEGRNPVFTGTSIDNPSIQPNTPTSFELSQNYPNPFNPTTSISFNLPKSQEITLKVFDMLGREVATLINSEQYAAGQSVVNFDASSLGSGVYIYRLTVGEEVQSRSMTLIK